MSNIKIVTQQTEMQSCWLCCSPTQLARQSVMDGDPKVKDFSITDAHYGRTGTLNQCSACGFIQCVDLGQVLSMYQDLDDPEYEEGRDVRVLQMKKLLKHFPPPTLESRLLDVGAGSGILLEAAKDLGWHSPQGVEPSRWLSERAIEHGLDVHTGVLPHDQVQGQFQAVMLVDVLEHVTDPLALLHQAVSHMDSEGRILVVTPDLNSLFARLLGWRWWHFRLAHVGYFNKKTLTLALEKCGLTPIHWFRPGWWFPLDYLLQRVQSYLPNGPWFRTPKSIRHIVVPLNLHDSLGVICKRSDSI